MANRRIAPDGQADGAGEDADVLTRFDECPSVCFLVDFPSNRPRSRNLLSARHPDL
jgi:hypothetical protein